MLFYLEKQKVSAFDYLFIYVLIGLSVVMSVSRVLNCYFGEFLDN